MNIARPVPKPRKRIVDRKAIRAAKRPRCQVCGSTWMLCVHHIRSRGAGGDDVPENLVCLCADCHAKAHAGIISKVRLRELAGR
ncbi:HNH endonuclease [Thermoanaerobacterium sp. DL9XJH110]|uniref:HNH endonuclease n=1 Tax=Thermoanaerobacterium sp. DL9XJH110 TaxID=3386643 RepID=UPI003BB67B5E